MKNVFVINGFLEAGKTEFIRFTISQPYFQTSNTTLLILCEEGENEIEEAILKGADYVCRFRREDETPHEPSTIIKVNTDGTFKIIRE